MGLNTRQRAFVNAYAGNATEAAIKAGYSKKTAGQKGHDLLKNVEIADAIRKREEKRENKRILTREQRQELWTKIATNANERTQDRLKASELLGKSEGDFIERINHSGAMEIKVNPEDLTDNELTEIATRGAGCS